MKMYTSSGDIGHGIDHLKEGTMSEKEFKSVILWPETKEFSYTGKPVSRKEWRRLERLMGKGWEWDGRIIITTSGSS